MTAPSTVSSLVTAHDAAERIGATLDARAGRLNGSGDAPGRERPHMLHPCAAVGPLALRP